MEELTRVRNELGWSQQKLADESGVNKATINQIERGKRSPNIETLQKLADGMGREIGDFFPKVQASLWSDNPPTERRAYRFAEFMVAAADKWMNLVSDPGTNNRDRYGISEAASAIGDAIDERVDDAFWDSLPNEDRLEIIRIMEKMTEVIERVTQSIKDDVLEEEARQNRKKIREWTRRLSA